MVAALVLSAGLGTRLRPLTLERPKALVPIGDRPALAHVIDRLASFGFGPLVVNAHHHADALEAFAVARASERASARFVVSREEELLGTAGGLRFARAQLTGTGGAPGDVVVWNGDLFAELSADLFAPLPHGAAAALVVQLLGGPGQGNVGLASDGRVVRLRSTSVTDGAVETRSASFLGAHRIGAELVERAPERGCLVGDLYIPALLRGERLIARPTEVPWIDVGSPAAYLAANLAWLGARASFVGEGADIGAEIGAGVTLRSVVIGAGARVVGEGVLERVVVWPGATARAMTDAIVTPSRVVRVES